MPDMQNSSPRGQKFRNILPQHFIKSSITFLFVLSVIMWAVYSFQSSSSLNELKQNETTKVLLGRNSIFKDLTNNQSDLMFLSDLMDVRHLAEATRLANGNALFPFDHVALEYMQFAKRKGTYDQIRFLDTKGNEIIRINFEHGQPVKVARGQLQNKSDRYYFLDTIRLNRGEVYISPFDLNIENGAIESPLKPMLRFATPTFGADGEKTGIVCINYLGAQLIQNFQRTAGDPANAPFLLNSDGYWLSSRDPAQEWGFMYPDRKELTFAKTHPAAWEIISREFTGQFANAAGLFTFATITPFGSGLSSSSGSYDPAQPSQRFFGSEKYQWKIVSRIEPETLGHLTQELKLVFALVWVFLALFGVLVCFFYAQNIALRREYNARLEKMATHDALTGLPNRNQFSERLMHNLAHAKRYNHKLCVLFMDLDGFKQVNDTYGHGVGDELLVESAKRIKQSIREIDTVARVGGDEFTVILAEIHELQEVQPVIQRIMEAVSQPFRFNDIVCHVGVSIGQAIFPDDGTDMETLLVKADHAMYKVKKDRKK